ncbi:MAG TPA: L,D-transpeptidase family protein [Blastocatellia bacterium]|nr:L,D-transpeptidase family protein [Blastocatellia bacterium]
MTGTARFRMQRINSAGLTLLIGLMLPATPQSNFKQQQMGYPRVKSALAEKEAVVKRLFEGHNIPYPPRLILIRVFKVDQVLELWAAKSDRDRFELLKQYKVCYSSGDVGPKRRMGDNQVPEGFYTIERFNPFSNFHLSLKVSYPNSSDRILGSGGNLGGDIFIHGNCVSIGCVAITDDLIKELYVIAMEARSGGQLQIPVHIFPTRLDDGGVQSLRRRYADSHPFWPFWSNLKQGFDFFEKHRRLPIVDIDRGGRYVFKER